MGVTRPPRVYRPPVAGEPLRLRDDGHWSTQGLVGYWPMREMRGSMTQDLSPFKRNLILSGPTWGAGEQGGALSFDGINDFAAYTPGAVVTGTALSLVFRASIPAQPANQVIVQQRDGASIFGQWVLRYAASELQRGLYFWDYTDIGGYGFNAGVISEFPTSTCAFAFVRNGLSGTFYLNGTAIGTITAARSVTYTNRVFAIGVDYRDTVNFCAMTMEDLSVYSRALSADEIAALYAAPNLPLWRPRRGISLALVGEMGPVVPGNEFVPPIGPRGGAHLVGPRVDGGARLIGPRVRGGAHRRDPYVR